MIIIKNAVIYKLLNEKQENIIEFSIDDIIILNEDTIKIEFRFKDRIS